MKPKRKGGSLAGMLGRVARCHLSKDPKEMKEHAFHIWEECARLRDRKE